MIRVLCAVFIIQLILCSCSSFSNQIKTTREGIKINYEPQKDISCYTKHGFTVIIYDERINKSIARDGALGIGYPHVTNILIGGALYPLMLALAPDLKMQDGNYQVSNIYKLALLGRLSKNDFSTSGDTNNAIVIELYIRELLIDFDGPYWKSESSFFVKFKFGDEYIFEEDVQEKEKLFNMWGAGTAQKVLNDAFSKSINRIDICGVIERINK